MLATLSRGLNRIDKHLIIKGFTEVTHRSETARSVFRRLVVMSGYDDDWYMQIVVEQHLLQFQAAHLWHVHVRNDAVVLCWPGTFEELFTGGESAHGILRGLQQPGDSASDR